MALKKVDSFVTSNVLDELIVIGYIRMCQVDISLTIPTPITDVIYKYYKRNSLEMIELARHDMNIPKIRFDWITNHFYVDEIFIDFERKIYPITVHNIRKYTTSILHLDIIPSKFISAVKCSDTGVVMSLKEHQVINKLSMACFGEVRHNDYINKQFGLINNPCKIVILKYLKYDKKGDLVTKLPVNVKILANIVLEIAKSLFNELQQIRDPKYDVTKQEFSIKHIKLTNKFEGKKRIFKCDKYITTNWDIGNDWKVVISIHIHEHKK